MSRHVAAAICFVFLQFVSCFSKTIVCDRVCERGEDFFEVLLSSVFKDISLLTALLPVEHVM